MTTHPVTIADLYVRHRHAILFYSLLLSLIIVPLSRPLGFGGTFVHVLLAVNLLAAAMALQAGAARRLALAILLLIVLAKPVAVLLGARSIGLLSQIVWSTFALFMAATAIRYSLRGQHIGGEQIYAALAAYLLAGLFFGQLYWVADQFYPQSLGGTTLDSEPSISIADAVYFSFVTLATLGYGDIVPVTPPLRGLAVLEAVGGQLYLAVLVARLVGAFKQGLADK